MGNTDLKTPSRIFEESFVNETNDSISCPFYLHFQKRDFQILSIVLSLSAEADLGKKKSFERRP